MVRGLTSDSEDSDAPPPRPVAKKKPKRRYSAADPLATSESEDERQPPPPAARKKIVRRVRLVVGLVAVRRRQHDARLAAEHADHGLVDGLLRDAAHGRLEMGGFTGSRNEAHAVAARAMLGLPPAVPATPAAAELTEEIARGSI